MAADSAAVLGATAGLVVGAMQYSRAAPVYQSSSEILVVEKRPDASLSDAPVGMEYVGDYVWRGLRLVESPLIIGRAIDSGAIPKRYSPGAIAKALTASKDGSVLVLEFEGPDPEDCRVILDAVIASYQEFLDETYRNVNEDSLKQITGGSEGSRGKFPQIVKRDLVVESVQ